MTSETPLSAPCTCICHRTPYNHICNDCLCYMSNRNTASYNPKPSAPAPRQEGCSCGCHAGGTQGCNLKCCKMRGQTEGPSYMGEPIITITNIPTKVTVSSKVTEGETPDLDGGEFYNLMQNYRHAPLFPQEAVTAAFEAVKAFIRQTPPAQ